MKREEIQQIFNYEQVLLDAKKEFEHKEVDSNSIFGWFNELGLTKYIRYDPLETLMFKLRDDLWKHKDKQRQ